MSISLEKIIEPEDLFLLQEGMRGISVIQGTLVSARFTWRDDKWWHVLIDPPKFQPVWIRVRKSSLINWTPDLSDPATIGVLLNRVSLLTGSSARFSGDILLLEDARQWNGGSKQKSLELFLENWAV